MKIIWTFIRRYAFQYWRMYLLGLLALLATNGLSVAIPWFLKQALMAVDPQIGDGQTARWVFLILGCAIGIIFVRTASRLLIFIPGREAEYELKNNYFAHLMSKQPPFFRRIEVGDLMSRGSNDIQFIRVLVGYAGLQILNVAFALPLNLTMMMDLSVSLTLGCVLPLVLAGFVMRYAVFRMMSRYLAAQQELSNLSEQILESYNGIAAVRSYHAQTAFQARFDRRNEKYVNTQIEISFVRSWLMPLVQVVGNLAILILLYWGGTKVVDGSLHFGAVSAFAVYVGNVVAALFSLSWVLNVIQRGSISLVRVMEVLDDPPLVPEVTDSLPSGALSIEARALTFCYPGAGREAALEGLSFSVPPGSTLGIFGTTGSGKSTLIRLLTRLETPPDGTLFVGGRDVVTLAASELRKAMAVVPQNPYLFGRSLAENIQLAVPDEELSDERISEMFRRACLLDELTVLPDGADTVVGERGVTLSGGQRQRTALARAFARHARIRLLDDALSAVDHDTEQRLIDSIYEDAKECTTILVSHRVSVLSHTNHILVLHEGRVVQQGTHAELIAADGLYSDAWQKHQRSGHTEGGTVIV